MNEQPRENQVPQTKAGVTENVDLGPRWPAIGSLLLMGVFLAPIVLIAGLAVGWDEAVRAGVAVLLCFTAAALWLALAWPLLGGRLDRQLIVVLGGPIFRIVLVLGGGLGLRFADKRFASASFLVWLAVFYLVTLAGESWLVLKVIERRNNSSGKKA